MKLFRKIRETLIQEGRTRRYLLYAIGEIFLVMIGISLAFQVDNWNVNRLKKDAENSYYKNIGDQIADDKALIQGQLRFNRHFMAQFNYANTIIEANDRTKMDTLGLIIRNLTQYSDFDRQGNIYETMVNSGEIKILRNHGIVNRIRNLEEKYIYINRMENIHYDAMMAHVVGVLSPVINYASAEIMKPEVVFNYEFQNLITILLQVMLEKDTIYQEAIIDIESIQELIVKELEQS